MELYLDDELICFTQDDLDYMYINEGTEGIVYKYKKDALKVYKDFSVKTRLDEDTAKEFTLINTNRILLPRKLLYDISSKFIGYSTMFLDDYSHKHISNMKMNQFIDEISLICMDSDNLASKHIDIEDLNSDNMIYDGNIYICDPGSYKIRKSDSVESVTKHNRQIIKEFLVDSILKQSVKLNKKQKSNLDNHFLNDDCLLEDMLLEETINDETVSSYVKRIV